MRSYLQAPFLTPEAVATASRARHGRLPAWLVGPPGCGAYSVARELHGGAAIGFVSVRTRLSGAAELADRVDRALGAERHLDRLTLFVDRVDEQPVALQEAVLRLIEEGAAFDGRRIPLRLIAHSTMIPPWSGASLLPALHFRLSPQTILLPPLSRRRGEIAAIAEGIARDVALELGVTPPGLSPVALRSLGLRDWPGDVEELESAVRAAMLRAPELDIPERAPPPRPRPVVASVGPPRTDPRGETPAVSGEELRRFELLIMELAHELKNPMVTIKTFAQQIDHLLDDEALREQFVRLTQEAVERMDGFLEELLQFARFSAPQRENVRLGRLLSQWLASNGAARSRVTFADVPEDVEVFVDPEQITFALRTLVRGMLRKLPEDAPIVLRWSARGELSLESAASTSSSRLGSLLTHEAEEEAEVSLDTLLSQSLIQRNGGTFRASDSGERLEFRLGLPTATR
ncbi:MAG: hypothetical protein QOD06_3128 [Candidatus Binatota bacterium]|nr:hypothetical protein [Candidatus Binatota bacterium]